MKHLLQSILFATALLLASAADAGNDTLYALEATASPKALQEGGKGSISLEIKSKEGAHVSAEAPLKVTLAGTNVKIEKDKLSRADAQPGTAESPKFVIPFTALAKGAASVDADVVFFICTENLCERQAKKISVPLTVN